MSKVLNFTSQMHVFYHTYMGLLSYMLILVVGLVWFYYVHEIWKYRKSDYGEVYITL